MDATSNPFLAAMLDCPDERQIRFHETRRPRLFDQTDAWRTAADETDPLQLMLECADPRQVRVHYREPQTLRRRARTA